MDLKAANSRVLREWAPIDALPSKSPIAAFSWGTGPIRGNPQIMPVISSGQEGLRVKEWVCNPFVWENAQQPPVMATAQNHSTIAANADGRVYAKADGAVWEYGLQSDLSTWTKVGTVETWSSDFN